MREVKLKSFLMFGAIIALAFFMRFWRLGVIPTGFHQDEVSQAYNAFAILTEGHDRYGEYYPILFRSFGSYQPSVYTYLSTVFVLIFGNTVLAARFLSALSGVIVVVFTYLIVSQLDKAWKNKIALLSSFVVAISPWAIHFSRRVVEGKLGMMFFVVSLFYFLKSLKNIKYFPLSMLFLGISTQAYYSERVIAIVFIPLFLFIYRKHFLKHKSFVIFGIIIFLITQIPHVLISTTGALARRFDQVSYFANDPGNLPKIIYIIREFVRHYFHYLSPSNLFAGTASDLGRVSPDLGVFFSWMFIPFLAGIYFFIKKIKGNFFKIIAILTPISLIPASLTGDVFYPLRTLEFLWCISIIIASGMYYLSTYIPQTNFKALVIAFLTLYSLSFFYISYFVLFKYETVEYVANTYIELDKKLRNYEGPIVIDSARDTAIGLRMAYFRKYSPKLLASTLRPQLTSNYYSGEVNINEVYKVDNIVVKTIDWSKDPCATNTLIIGDPLSVSSTQAEEHGLISEFDIKGADGHIYLSAYKTTRKCK